MLNNQAITPDLIFYGITYPHPHKIKALLNRIPEQTRIEVGKNSHSQIKGTGIAKFIEKGVFFNIFY